MNWLSQSGLNMLVLAKKNENKATKLVLQGIDDLKFQQIIDYKYVVTSRHTLYLLWLERGKYTTAWKYTKYDKKELRAFVFPVLPRVN